MEKGPKGARNELGGYCVVWLRDGDARLDRKHHSCLEGVLEVEEQGFLRVDDRIWG